MKIPLPFQQALHQICLFFRKAKWYPTLTAFQLSRVQSSHPPNRSEGWGPLQIVLVFWAPSSLVLSPPVSPQTLTYVHSSLPSGGPLWSPPLLGHYSTEDCSNHWPITTLLWIWDPVSKTDLPACLYWTPTRPSPTPKHAACNHKKHSLKAQKGTVIICVSHLVLILKMRTLEVNSAMQHDWFKAERLSRGRN